MWFALLTYIPISYLMYTGAFSYHTPEPTSDGLRFHGRGQPGDLLFIAIGWGVLLIGVLVFYLVKDLFTSKDDIHLRKVHLMLLAVIVSGGLAALFNAIPSLRVYPIDIVGQLVTAFTLTYAILNFELVDVSTKLHNLIVEIIFTTALAAVFLALAILTEIFLGERIWWVIIILAIFISSLLQPFKDWLLSFVDTTFYRTRYDYRETINKFVKGVRFWIWKS